MLAKALRGTLKYFMLARALRGTLKYIGFSGEIDKINWKDNIKKIIKKMRRKRK